MTMKQIPLSITLPKSSTFSGYFGERNNHTVEAVQQYTTGSGPGPIYLYGPTGCGKTHLLHAACTVLASQRQQPFYLSLSDCGSLSPKVLRDLEELDLIALDDLQCIAGDDNWELALFTLFNSVVERGGRLLITANTSIDQLGICLPDLRSRIGWCTIFRLEELEDPEKIGALQAQARRRGMELNDEVGRYLLSRVRRDMGSLLEVLDQLDDASLVAQRRLTIPFVRGILNP